MLHVIVEPERTTFVVDHQKSALAQHVDGIIRALAMLRVPATSTVVPAWFPVVQRLIDGRGGSGDADWVDVLPSAGFWITDPAWRERLPPENPLRRTGA